MQPGPLLMPDEIVEQMFSTTRFRAGYDQDQVDHWLDGVVATMRQHLAGSHEAGPIRADDVAAVQFTQTRFRDGYDMAEVDDFLDRVHATLAALERGERPS
ncbi:DivIVA domain-containing protein [Agrococcus jejuensis]|uniref:DivIVA domain-containing protein n=1 Tax=Agrococcus jejuensis TaxID=399736 RepID=UPI0016423C56|nr:DivIVA domain-containing protein [Agrococcus jejuensis]